MHSLEQFVHEWWKKHGQDLPWVIRKPGMKLFVDMVEMEATSKVDSI